MAYFRRLLAPGEELVADLHPHCRTLVGPGVLLVLLGGLTSYAMAAMPSGRWHRPGQLAVLVAALLLALVACVLPYLRWRTTHFVLTDRRVAVRTGVVARQGRDVPLQRISDVTFARSPLDRLFGSGTLTVESAGEHGRLAVANLPGIESVYRQLYELLEADDTRRYRDTAQPEQPQWG